MAAEDPCCMINDLPDEILLKIFTKLSLLDLLIIRPVCKRWLCLSKDESLWVKVDLSNLFIGSGHINREKNAEDVEILLSDIQNCVEKLIFNNIPFDGETYELYCRSENCGLNLKKLKSLDYSYSAVSLCHLRRALSTYSTITELILIHTNVLFSDLIKEALHLPQLKKIVFYDIHAWENFLDHPQEFSRNINSRSLTQIPKRCPDLEWVELFTLWAEFDNTVIHQFMKHCSSLKKLYFTWSTHLTEAAFQNANQGNTVTHLGLADRQDIGPYLRFILPYFPHLVSLTMDWYQVYMEDCITLGKCCPNLQELSFDVGDMRGSMNTFSATFHDVNNILDGSKLHEISAHCKQLRKIHAPCSNVDDESFSHLVKNCPHLEDINFLCCPLLTPECLYLLSKHSPNIQLLNFQHNFDSHDYVTDLFSNCLQLKEAILDRKIDESTYAACPISFLPSSDSFSLLNAPEVNRPCPGQHPLSPVSDNIEELPFIDLISSQEYEDPSSSARRNNLNPLVVPDCHGSLQKKNYSMNTLETSCFVPVLPVHCHVSTLSLQDVRLSSVVLQQIFQMCPDLTHVDLDRCSGLNDETIKILAMHCQGLRVLKMSARGNDYVFVGDDALKDLCRYSRNLETLSVLNNRNISHKGVCCILDALDNSLRQLQSLSFCVGTHFKCKLPLPDLNWLQYLSKQSIERLDEITSSKSSIPFRILHLEFLPRREKRV